jgi:hypothetical protein
MTKLASRKMVFTREEVRKIVGAPGPKPKAKPAKAKAKKVQPKKSSEDTEVDFPLRLDAIQNLTVAELKVAARKAKVDLKGITRKSDIIKALTGGASGTGKAKTSGRTTLSGSVQNSDVEDETTEASNAIADKLVDLGLTGPHFRERASFIFGCTLTRKNFQKASKALELLQINWEYLLTNSGDIFSSSQPQLVFGFKEETEQLVMTLEMLPLEAYQNISKKQLFDLAKYLDKQGFKLYGVAG